MGTAGNIVYLRQPTDDGRLEQIRTMAVCALVAVGDTEFHTLHGLHCRYSVHDLDSCNIEGTVLEPIADRLRAEGENVPNLYGVIRSMLQFNQIAMRLAFTDDDRLRITGDKAAMILKQVLECERDGHFENMIATVNAAMNAGHDQFVFKGDNQPENPGGDTTGGT